MVDSASTPTFKIDARDPPPMVRRIVERFVHAFAPESIVLFGSCAKGTNQPDSDLDLLVVAEVDGDPDFHRRRARQLAADCFPPVDVVFATPEEVTAEAIARSPFLLSIRERGLVVFTRSETGGKEIGPIHP